MSYHVEIVADSLNTATGARLTTFRCTYPRFVLAEVNTHRQFSRNTASSRAIPTRKLVEAVRTHPVIPSFGKNQPGMQAGDALTDWDAALAEDVWRTAADAACTHAEQLMALGVHKQAVNRLLEPYLWVTSLLTATEFGNWFALRAHPDAQPEIAQLADLMLAAYVTHTPTLRFPFGWHLPLIDPTEPWVEGTEPRLVACVSAARCARVSYSRFDQQPDVADDLALATRLADAGHWSPFEHQAYALTTPDASGNLRGGWQQFRHTFPNECRTPDLLALARDRTGGALDVGDTARVGG